VTLDSITCHSLIRVDYEKLAEEVFGFGRDIGPPVTSEFLVVISFLDQLEQLEVVFVVEGWSSTQHDEEDDSQTPVVTLLTVGLVGYDLGRDISWGPALGGSQLFFSGVHVARQTEIGDFNLCVTDVLVIEQQILGLDVTMHDLMAVAVDDRVKKGGHDAVGEFLAELLLFDDVIEKFSAAHELHDQAVVTRIFVEVDKFDDVGMVEGPEDVNLVLHGQNVLFLHLAL